MMLDETPTFSVSDFVAVFNQTLEFTYPRVSVVGELANFKVSKNRWVYFDLKDEFSNVKFFGTVYQLPGPLEDGMMLEVSGQPRLSPKYGFSINILQIKPVGEGSIKKAAALLEAKLKKEGLFDESRKRPLPYPPRRIGLITSAESAAYKDFTKVIKARWCGLEIILADVGVQGDQSPAQIIQAIEWFNTHDEQVDVLVATRGGGSPDDLAAFSSEQVTRAVAASRIPTLVAVGHEIDVSLAELAADKRASTPSNAAELLVPDKTSEADRIAACKKTIQDSINNNYKEKTRHLKEQKIQLGESTQHILWDNKSKLENRQRLLAVLSPESVLERGYSIIRDTSDRPIKTVGALEAGQKVVLQFKDGQAGANIIDKNRKTQT